MHRCHLLGGSAPAEGAVASVTHCCGFGCPLALAVSLLGKPLRAPGAQWDREGSAGQRADGSTA
eukprot:355617-Chlamydomonas_euryale.AAC.5